jgi:hypothetical protein
MINWSRASRATIALEGNKRVEGCLYYTTKRNKKGTLFACPLLLLVPRRLRPLSLVDEIINTTFHNLAHIIDLHVVELTRVRYLPLSRSCGDLCDVH